MKRGTREYTVWSIGLFVIIAASLIPVLWIASLSLKAPATIGEGRCAVAMIGSIRYVVRHPARAPDAESAIQQPSIGVQTGSPAWPA